MAKEKPKFRLPPNFIIWVDGKLTASNAPTFDAVHEEIETLIEKADNENPRWNLYRGISGG